MAIDTKEKRLSMLNLGLPWFRALPEPAASIAAGDRQHLLGLYSGIAASTAVPKFPGSVAATATGVGNLSVVAAGVGDAAVVVAGVGDVVIVPRES